MMCAVAPSALPGLAAQGCYCGGYDAAADMDALLRDIHAAVRPRTPPAAMSTAEFLALSRPINDAADFDLGAVLRGIRSIRIPAAGFAPPPVPVDFDVVATPTTPVASLPAPLSYGDAEDAAAAATTQNNDPLKKQQDPGEPYDADIDAAIRAMERDPAERSSVNYLWTVQAGGITMADRAHLVSWMYNFSGYYSLAPGTLHRAVSYADRFLSTTTVNGFNELLLVGAAAVFVAAKYEDRRATVALNADAIAWHVGCTRRDVVDAERVLFAALGCRLSGPTAHTFVEHFTRHEGAGGSTSTVRLVAHHLADVALLDYRSIRFLPSAVAAAAIALAEMAVNPAAAASWISDEMVEVTGYALEDLAVCMAEIEEMRELQGEWPGCAQMTEDFVRSYGLVPR
ncbi:unnamed protein product [Urochloa decumbens]|uniref:Cyclin N-terminal domain-containing protein n=1 Tax=Urochloa decumbens TaxID=240449 RepID=A0ABC9EG27_9POAL